MFVTSRTLDPDDAQKWDISPANIGPIGGITKTIFDIFACLKRDPKHCNGNRDNDDYPVDTQGTAYSQIPANSFSRMNHLETKHL